MALLSSPQLREGGTAGMGHPPLCYCASMLEGPVNGPVTAFPLNATLLRIRGRDKWLPIDATVYSCEYTSKPGVDVSVGHYHVIYSYSVGGEIYTGQFVDYGMADEASLKRDDTVEVRYDPLHPERSFYPELRTDHPFLLISALVGIAAGLLITGIALLTRYGH